MINIADIIVDINDERITDENKLLGIMQESRAGDLWKMKIYRDKKIVSLDMRLEKQK